MLLRVGDDTTNMTLLAMNLKKLKGLHHKGDAWKHGSAAQRREAEKEELSYVRSYLENVEER